jgi:hypothetical protein
MKSSLTRRDFLKMGALGMASLAFRPSYDFGELQENENLARVAVTSVSVHSQPDENSRILFQRYRDEIVNIYYDEVSDGAPRYNPLWHRVWGGYIHSAHMQKVKVRLNPVQTRLFDSPHIAEITVPFSQCYLHRKETEWTPIYRLYYESVHWVVGVIEGPDGTPWYRIKDEMLTDDNLNYYVPARHVRFVGMDELTPIHADIPAEQKRVDVSITRQELTAYEADKVVLKTKISSGLHYSPPGEIPWDTPLGKFFVQSKMPSKHMGSGQLTDDLEEYILPGVPWTSFFETTNGIAFHGTYWHNNFGVPMSHGCINMRMDEAKWIFRWLTPKTDLAKMNTVGQGTLVKVFED